MAKSRFKITPFTNPSGKSAYRVSGTLNGERIRKNFKTRQEAVAERQKLEIRRLNETSKGQTVWTTLTHEQNRDAILATNMLKRSKLTKSLSFAVEFFLQHYKEPAQRKTVTEAVDEYKEEKSNELARGIISGRQEKSIRMEMNRFKNSFEGWFIEEILTSEIKTYLNGSKTRSKAVASLKTWNNRRSYLNTFFSFCLTKKYVAENPMLEIPQFKVKKARGTAETLNAKEAKKLMHWLESYRGKQNNNGSWWGKPGCMVPYFALTLFAGIRPDWKDGEISRLRQRDIRFDTGVILIEPGVSKVHEKRTIKIQPNLQLWLEKYPISEYPIITKRRFYDLWADVRKEWKLGHNVLRHTFVSMLVGAFRSVGDAALQSGNSEAVIRKHYLNLKSEEEANQFWKIIPKGDET